MPSKHDYPEDLFEGTKMTFGEHLEELRKCFFRALVGLIIAFIVTLVLDWPDRVVAFIQTPLQKALEDFQINKSIDDIGKLLDTLERGGVQTPEKAVIEETIRKARVTPMILYTDPRQIVQASGEMYGVPLPERGVRGLNGADIVNGRAFSGRVYEQRDEEGQPGYRVWQLLSEPARELVRQGAEEGLSRQEKQQLAAELEAKVVTDPGFLAQSRAFFDEATSPEYALYFIAVFESDDERARQAARVKALLAQADNDEIATDLLNRQLLNIAFPDGIAGGPQLENMVPVTFWRPVVDDPRVRITSLNPSEMFMIWMKAAILISLVVASPWVFYQIWTFVAAGLYPHERRYIHIYLPFSIALFLSGVALCFFFVFEPVLNFLFTFNKWMNVDPDMRISEWFGFAIFLPLGFGIAFQLPLVMLFLERIGVFSVKMYLSKWRISVLVIFVISMILTPADPYSMLLMAIPLTLLYFGGALMCKLLPRSRNPFGNVEETA
jgi:sec-independent protein translocase protein TatC